MRTSPPTSTEQARLAEKEPEKVTPKLPRDESFSVEEYYRLGLPELDKPWTCEDLVKAEQVLAAISKKDPRNLPRYQSARSGEVFARIVSQQNLAVIRDSGQPVEKRLRQLYSYLNPLQKLLVMYLSAIQKKIGGEAEFVELSGVGFRMYDMMYDLIDQFVAQLDKSHPRYMSYLASMEESKIPSADVLCDAILILPEDRDKFGRSTLVRLIGLMKETYPSMVPRMPPPSRTRILALLTKLETDSSLEDLRSNIKDLRVTIAAEVAKRMLPK